MSSRFVNPRPQFGNSAGDASLAGAKLNTYEAGTTTALATYSDAALTTLHTNPVVADAAGRFADIYLGDSSYRFVLTDANDNQIWDVDNYYPQGAASRGVSTLAALKALAPGISEYAFINYSNAPACWYEWNGSSTATADGYAIVQADAGGDGRWLMMRADAYYPEWFGADRDGTDDAAAIQRCIDYVEDNFSGGKVQLLEGVYGLASGLRISEPVSFTGPGYGDDTSSASQPTDPLCSLKCLTADITMLTAKSQSEGNRLWGVTIGGFALEGNNLAGYGFLGSSLYKAYIDLWAERCRLTGIRFDDGNKTLSAFVDIKRAHYQAGNNAAAAKSSGIVFYSFNTAYIGLTNFTIDHLAADITQATVTSVTNNGGVARFNCSADHDFEVGDTIFIYNTDVPGYRTSAEITAVPLSSSFECSDIAYVSNGDAIASVGHGVEIHDADSFSIQRAQTQTVYFGPNRRTDTVTLDSVANVSGPLFTTGSAYRFKVGDVVTIDNTLNYDGSYEVATTPSSTTFTLTGVNYVGETFSGATVGRITREARKNTFTHLGSHVVADEGSLNTALNINSEPASVTLYGDAVFHFTAIDRVTGSQYRSFAFDMYEELKLSTDRVIFPSSGPHSGEASIGTTGGISAPVVSFGATNDEAARWTFGPPEDWDDGTFTKLVVYFFAAASGDQSNWQLDIDTPAEGQGLGSYDYTTTFDIDTPATTNLTKAEINISHAYAFGDSIIVRLSRLANSGGTDNQTGAVQVLSAHLVYEGRGPSEANWGVSPKAVS